MRKFLLYSSALVVSGLLSGVAEAACIQTPTCSSLGYTSSSSCTGGTKCPFGNAWNCTVVDLTNKITEITNKITTIEEKITEIEENGGGSGGTNPAIGDCVVGAILNSDKTCSSEVISSKTPIGVVFEKDLRLAIAKVNQSKEWGPMFEDTPIQNSSTSNAQNDWSGKYNTEIMIEYCKKNNFSCPAFEYAASYKTEGTSAGDWYLPAAGEIYRICQNKSILNTALLKIGGTALPDGSHWSSSENSFTDGIYLNFKDGKYFNTGNVQYTKANEYIVRPVIAF